MKRIRVEEINGIIYIDGIDIIKKVSELSKENDRLYLKNKRQKEVIDKAIETLEKGITFCENDSQGIYDKCNIATNREKEVLDILKEVSE
ncbi:MAG: hypothetical protein J6D28_04565 [Bacilli bacterium]|nr:hypothetical protein [Bacilli bacterium]